MMILSRSWGVVELHLGVAGEVLAEVLGHRCMCQHLRPLSNDQGLRKDGAASANLYRWMI